MLLGLNACLLQTNRRIFCIAILNLWAGVDNIIAGVTEYFSDAGVGVLAVFALSFLLIHSWQCLHAISLHLKLLWIGCGVDWIWIDILYYSFDRMDQKKDVAAQSQWHQVAMLWYWNGLRVAYAVAREALWPIDVI